MLSKEILDTYVQMSQSTLEDQELLSGIILNNIDDFDISEIILLYWTMSNERCSLFIIIRKLELDDDKLNQNELSTFNFESLYVYDDGTPKYISFNNYPQAHKQIKQTINKNPQLWEQFKKKLKSSK